MEVSWPLDHVEDSLPQNPEWTSVDRTHFIDSMHILSDMQCGGKFTMHLVASLLWSALLRSGMATSEVSSLQMVLKPQVSACGKPANISIPVDHFNPTDFRTYSKRYWFDSTYYKPSGPIFF